MSAVRFHESSIWLFNLISVEQKVEVCFVEMSVIVPALHLEILTVLTFLKLHHSLKMTGRLPAEADYDLKLK